MPEIPTEVMGLRWPQFQSATDVLALGLGTHHRHCPDEQV